MAKSLVIVESPAKAKTINKFLGKDFFVEASMGHVRDLPPKKIGIDIEHDFEPEYQILTSRKKTIQELKKSAKKADAIYLAPDLDREGEAIAWHLIKALDLEKSKKKVYRVVFNEITKKAILEAFKNAGDISMDKVCAQQARRILDRLVGYQISPLLWRKIAKGLSAGRVQSVTVKLIADREKEILAFKAKEYWKVTAKLAPDGGAGDETKQFEAELAKIAGKKADLENEKQTSELVERLRETPFVVAKFTKKEKQERALPPFATSTLQQQASIQLRFSTKKTMMIAQQLYEGVDIGPEGSVGLITYMRTDSLRVSDEAIAECRDVIKEKFGKEYLPDKPHSYRAGKGAQGAHEAVRPSSAAHTPEQLKQYLSRDQFRLYDLIWKRFVASQAKSARFYVTEIEVEADDCIFKTRGKELLFDGHYAVIGLPNKTGEQMLPPLDQGQALDLVELSPSQHFTQPPPRYSEATLVKTLEKNGVGRPSTYAPIISTIQARGYVEQKERRFYATELGIIVTDKLTEHFPTIMNIEFTSHMEEELDKIEEQGMNWVEVLREFYGPFKENLDAAKKEMEDVRKQLAKTDEKCPECKEFLMVRMSKQGKFLGCSGYPKCKFTKPIEGEEKPKAKIPEELGEKDFGECEKCGSKMVVRSGARGLFIACSGFPKCRNTQSLPGGDESGVQTGGGTQSPPEETSEKCEKCESPMVIRHGKAGKFLACSAYPKCRFTKSLPTGVKCPQEDCDGDLISRRGRGGSRFFGCSKYPECEFVTNKLPEEAE